MRLYSSDEKLSVDVGTWSIWYSIYSTAVIKLSDNVKNKIPQALSFLKTGDCLYEDVRSTKEQFLVVINKFSSLSPTEVIWDLNKPNMAPPWGNYIAPTITSCANLYTTADGKDLFTEVVTLLSYAQENNVSIYAG